MRDFQDVHGHGEVLKVSIGSRASQRSSNRIHKANIEESKHGSRYVETCLAAPLHTIEDSADEEEAVISKKERWGGERNGRVRFI